MMKSKIFFRKEKNLQFLFQNVSKKEEKNRNKNGGRNMKNTKVYVDFITEKLKKLLSIMAAKTMFFSASCTAVQFKIFVSIWLMFQFLLYHSF